MSRSLKGFFSRRAELGAKLTAGVACFVVCPSEKNACQRREEGARQLTLRALGFVGWRLFTTALLARANANRLTGTNTQIASHLAGACCLQLPQVDPKQGRTPGRAAPKPPLEPLVLDAVLLHCELLWVLAYFLGLRLWAPRRPLMRSSQRTVHSSDAGLLLLG